MATENTESVIELYNALVTLTNTEEEDRDKRAYQAGQVLFEIFDIETDKRTLTESEKKKIGPLLIKALPSIELCIDFEALRFFDTNFMGACYTRSGLQFLLDRYENYFPEEDLEKTGETLQTFLTYLDIEDLDGLLASYTLGEFDPCYSKFQRVCEKLKEVGAEEKHSWWP